MDVGETVVVLRELTDTKVSRTEKGREGAGNKKGEEVRHRHYSSSTPTPPSFSSLLSVTTETPRHQVGKVSKPVSGRRSIPSRVSSCSPYLGPPSVPPPHLSRPTPRAVDTTGSLSRLQLPIAVDCSPGTEEVTG